MAKILVPATSFDPATRQVVLPFAVDLARVYAVINATRGVTYYTIGDPAQVATVSGSTITLNTSFGGGGHSASDRISVWYETTDAQPVSDGGASLTVDGPLTNAELRATPVPVVQTGVATAANQATANATLGDILTEITALEAKTPASPADSARQDTANTQLTNLNTALGARADAAATDDTGTFSLLAFIKRGLQNWTTLLSRIPSLIGGAFPVTELPLVITGAAAQTAVVNNILDTVAGPGWLDVRGYRSASIQVVSTGTGGTFIFEQSNDGVNPQAIVVKNGALTTGAVVNAAITATASSIIYRFPVGATFIRLRIASTITGGSIQAFTRLSTEPFTDIVQNVGQPTAGSLNVTPAAVAPAAGTNLSNDVAIQVRANATGAASPVNLNSPATPVGQSVKGSAGRVVGGIVTNTGAATRWLKLFNATAVTPGTTAATWQIAIPANSQPFAFELPAGVSFGTGIQAMITGGFALNDNTGITANDVTGVLFFA